jgi:hypothetical protein
MAARIGLVVHVLSDAAVRELAALGVRQVRWTLYWSRWDDADPVRRAAYRASASAEVARARAAKLDLLVCAHSVPGHLVPAGKDEYAAREPILAAYVRWLADRAAAWRGLAWQPWNEMDGDPFTGLFGGRTPTIGMRMRGSLYGQHLRAVAAALRAADSTARLVAGAPGGGSPDVFLAGMLDAGEPLSVSALAFHAYGPPCDAAIVQRGAAVRAALARAALPVDRALPLWLTEFGISGRDMRRAWLTPAAEWESRQRDEWARAAEAVTRVGAERAYGYCLEDEAVDGYGVVQGGRRRLVGAWLASGHGAS